MNSNKKKRILITGASGLLGWNLFQNLPKDWEGYGTVLSNQVTIPGAKITTLDITNFSDLKSYFQEIRPDAVLHTAAISAPNACQLNPEDSHKVNVDASANLAGLCSDVDIPLVFTSSDLVFNGLKAPYAEEDPVCPISIYGEQKVAAEEEMKKRYPKRVVCRMPLMFGVPGPFSQSFMQPFLKAMREGQELNLFTDEYRTPLSVRDAVSGLFLALEKESMILHLGGNERVSRYEFGELIAQIFKIKDAKLIPGLQRDVKMPAPRPPDVSMDNTRACYLGFNPSTLKKELSAIHINDEMFRVESIGDVFSLIAKGFSNLKPAYL